MNKNAAFDSFIQMHTDDEFEHQQTSIHGNDTEQEMNEGVAFYQ